MRKGLLFSALALGMGLFSCTQEDLTNRSAAAGGPVTVSVGLPEGSSRSVPTAPEGYDLRCVLQVVYGDGNETLTLTEKAGDAGSNISFHFQPKSSDYNCLFWADYVTEGTETDRFYNTADLTKIGYVQSALTDGSLFNNDACDAFCGTKDAQSIMDAGNQVNVTLFRPFMKVSIVDKQGVSGDRLSVTMASMPSGYNVLTGEYDESTVTMSMTDADLSGSTDDVWFSNYMFAPSNMSVYEASNITMTVTTDGEEPVVKTLDGDINVGANTTYNGNIEFSLDDVTVEVGIDGDDAASLPKVGDYYYSDGTWSADYNSEKTVIGVVFATKDNVMGDVPANYEGVTFAKGYIQGWVVGAKEADKALFVSSGKINTIDKVGQGAEDIKGYANKAAWESNALSGATYTALDCSAYSLSAPESNTSGWYLPALGQMDALRSVYLANESVVKAALQALSDNEIGDLMSEESGASNYYWTSSANLRTADNQAYLITFTASESYYTGASGEQSRRIRPVLTF